MFKKYGLIIPGEQKKPFAKELASNFTKPTIFDESSSESDGTGPPQLQIKKAPMEPSLMERRKAKNLQAKALAEDPTIFQYDELYDDMENKREEEKQVKSKEPKKPKYIIKLLEAADKRKLENELRVERQVQKEREAEGEEFNDKEKFVTSAYRKKLEEMRKLEEKNKRNDYLEAIGDVTKQKDLDGFYRHIYEQKMGTSKESKQSQLQHEVTNFKDGKEDGVAYKPIKSGKIIQQRAYRKRKGTDDEEIPGENLKQERDKKLHLTNHIDADSDFSIDDSSMESESQAEDNKVEKNSKKCKAKQKPSNVTKDSKISKTPASSIALNLKCLNPEEQKERPADSGKENTLSIPTVTSSDDVPPIPRKRDKAEVWRKRTVGEVYIAAVQRYYERKAARNQA